MSYRSVIKDTVIEKKTLVRPPIMDKIFENYTSANGAESEIDIEDVYKKITNEANENSEKIIQEANEKARLILEEANNQVEAIKSKAFDEGKESGYQEGYMLGYKDGYDHGIQETKKEADEIINNAEAVRKEADEYLRNSHEAVETFLKDYEKEIVKLSVNIAKQILNTEISTNPEAIYKLAEKVLSNAIDRKQIIIKVNPRDFGFLKKRKEELSIYVEDSNNIIIVADSSINPGSIKAETSSGFLDGDIDSQLDLILQSLTGEKNEN